MKNKLIVLSGFVLGLAPVVAFAQTSGVSPVQQTCANALNQGTLESIICRIGSILNTIIPFLIVLGVVYFVFGVITYMIGSDEEAKKKGRNRVIFGIIGLAVIVGLWGLVNIITKTFNIQSGGPVNVPCISGTPGC